MISCSPSVGPRTTTSQFQLLSDSLTVDAIGELVSSSALSQAASMAATALEVVEASLLPATTREKMDPARAGDRVWTLVGLASA